LNTKDVVIFGSKHEVFSQLWTNEKKPKAIVILVHGLGEHCGRYSTHFAEHFINNGFAILTFDLPGHGKSSGKRGCIKSAQYLSNIIRGAIDFARKMYPDVPVFMYGHSLGGEIALWYLLQNHPPIQGAVITSPAIRVSQPVSTFKKISARLLSRLIPDLVFANDLDVDKLSRDKGVVKAYKNDALVHDRISTALAAFILNQGEMILSNASKNTIPLLLMVGTDEGIVSQKAIKDFSSRAKKCELKIWPNLYHEIHNEPEKDQVFKYTTDWLNTQI